MLSDLYDAPREMRWDFLAGLTHDERVHVFAASRAVLGTPYALWHDDPVQFFEAVLGQTLWSKQREVCESVGQHQITAVPSAFGTGKTRSAGGLVCWHSSVHPPGTALTVTTATRFRQVKRQLWPEIRALALDAVLPGQVDTTQWKMLTAAGADYVVAYGFTVPPTDEAAGQGIHAPRLFVIIDEGGGIARPVGRALRGLMTGPDTRMLVIGNPPTDDERSWFEGLCSDPAVNTIRIPLAASPNWTGEDPGPCRACPTSVPEHSVARHLVGRSWEIQARKDHGEGSPYYVAKAKAEFPRGGANRAVPWDWIEAAVDAATEPNEHPDVVPDLVTDHMGRPLIYQPVRGAWIRLGVDVAADGGDEFVIARAEGPIVRIVHSASGAENHNSVDVAGVVLRHIREAQALARAVGSTKPVRVKVDAIGVGWGVASTLEAWGAEGLHDAEIVRVVVSERVHPSRNNEGSTLRPANKRSELWLGMRALLQPDSNGQQGVVLDVDERTAAQLGGPTMGTNGSALTVIESKESMRKRGLPSPDRAEAASLSVYEPEPVRKKKRILAGA